MYEKGNRVTVSLSSAYSDNMQVRISRTAATRPVYVMESYHQPMPNPILFVPFSFLLILAPNKRECVGAWEGGRDGGKRDGKQFVCVKSTSHRDIHRKDGADRRTDRLDDKIGRREQTTGLPAPLFLLSLDPFRVTRSNAAPELASMTSSDGGRASRSKENGEQPRGG